MSASQPTLSPTADAALKGTGFGLQVAFGILSIPAAVVAYRKLRGGRTEPPRRHLGLGEPEGGVEMQEVDDSPLRRAFLHGYMGGLRGVNNPRQPNPPGEAAAGAQENAPEPQALNAVVVHPGGQEHPNPPGEEAATAAQEENAPEPQALDSVPMDPGDQRYMDFLNECWERMQREVEARDADSS